MTRLLTLARSGRQQNRLHQARTALRAATDFASDLATGRLITVDAYMRRCGIEDEDFIHRYASQLGKAVKAAYVARHGVEPPSTWELRKGSGLLAFKVIRPNVYRPDDPALAEGWDAYPRTSELATVPAARRAA